MFLFISTRSGLLAEIRWSVCTTKSQRISCISFFWTESVLCRYHLVAWSNVSLLHNSQLVTFSTQLCLVFYSFWACFLLFIRWLTVSSLFPHNRHLLFCCIWSIFALIQVILMAFVLLCYQKRFSFSLRFLFRSPAQVFLCAICQSVAWNFRTVVILLIFVSLFMLFFCLFLWCQRC